MVILDAFLLVTSSYGSYSHLKLRYSHFSRIGQEYPFLQVSEIFLSRPAVSA